MDARYLRHGFWLRLVIISVVGASAMHLVEYHLALGFRGDAAARLRSMAWMIEHCPMRGPLGIVAALFVTVAALTGIAMWRQVKTLEKLRVAGSSRTHAVGGRPAIPSSVGSRVPAAPMVVSVVAILAVSQWLVFTVAGDVAPMDSFMRMHSQTMLMAVSPPIAPWLLAVAMAWIEAVALWRFERMALEIADAIDVCLRSLFGQIRSDSMPVVAIQSRPIVQRFGPVLFSRPPPEEQLTA